MVYSAYLMPTKHSFFNLIRDSVVEILFEQDNEEKSVATLILDSLMQVFLFCEIFKFMTTALYNVFILAVGYIF